MKKYYETPDIELMKFSFESILEGDDHYIQHSIGEGYAEGGDEGRD